MTKTYGMLCKADGQRGFTGYSLSLTRDDALRVSNLLSDRIGKVVTLSGGRTMTRQSATTISYANPHQVGSARDATLIAESLKEGLNDILEQSRLGRNDDEDD